LLDACALLWSLSDDPNLSAAAKTAIQDPANARWVSPISLPEIAIKVRIGSLQLKRPFGMLFPAELLANDIHLLPIESRHIEPLTTLPFHHWQVDCARPSRPVLPSAGLLRRHAPGTGRPPAASTPNAYPLRIDWDGILADDPDHPDDIIRRVRDVLEVILTDRSYAIEKEACEILGVPELRDYFRKPGAGGFWDDHIKRYSKSRRKAPIYWLLQSSKKNYALWLYYHRLDKDILFKALLNYIEPKIRLESSRLETLRSEKNAARESAKEATRLAKEVERQEDFLSELHDFEDKLRRVANLHLEPDLNDGVVLNIAPLHELVPWKEARKYWDELLEGKYEWSAIGKQLRAKGLVK
jgi:PIN domain nuclease of toxin-antitoxin system